MRSRIRSRWIAAFVVIACATSMSLVHGTAAGAAKKAPLSIKIVGNHFVERLRVTRIRLLGVNHTSAEYGCVDGFGYDDGHFNNADAAAIASWGANAVRVPLNEDCWLGINGQPNSNEGADPPLTQGRLPPRDRELRRRPEQPRPLRDPRPALDGARQPGRPRAAADARPGPLAGVLALGGLDVQEQPRRRLRPVQRALRPDRPEVRRRQERRTTRSPGTAGTPAPTNGPDGGDSVLHRRLRREQRQDHHLPDRRAADPAERDPQRGREAAGPQRRAGLRQRPRRQQPRPLVDEPRARRSAQPGGGVVPQLHGQGVRQQDLLEERDRAGRQARARRHRRVRRGQLPASASATQAADRPSTPAT